MKSHRIASLCLVAAAALAGVACVQEREESAGAQQREEGAKSPYFPLSVWTCIERTLELLAGELGEASMQIHGIEGACDWRASANGQVVDVSLDVTVFADHIEAAEAVLVRAREAAEARDWQRVCDEADYSRTEAYLARSLVLKLNRCRNQ